MKKLLFVSLAASLVSACSQKEQVKLSADEKAKAVSATAPDDESSADKGPNKAAMTAETDKPGLAEGDFVFVYSDAEFYESTEDGAKSYRAADWSRERASRTFEPVYRARVASDNGEWVEVRTLQAGGPDELCDSRQLFNGRPIGLSLFVEREDLAPTVTRPVTSKGDDGTSVSLKPGVRLEPVDGKEGTYRVWQDDVAVTVELPADAVGLDADSYESFDVSGDYAKAAPTSAVWMAGDHRVEFDADAASRVPVVVTSGEGEEKLVQLSRSCLKVTAAVDTAPSPIQKKSGADSIQNLGSNRMPVKYIAAAGSDAFWADGRHAGKTAGKLRLAKGILGDKTLRTVEVEGDKLTCYTDGLMWTVGAKNAPIPDNADVEYCFKQDALSEVEQPKSPFSD